MSKSRDRSSPSPGPTPTPVEIPSPVARAAVPLCLVVDDEPSTRHYLSLILRGLDIETVELADGAALNTVRTPRAPALIFFNVSIDSTDAIKAILMLAKRGYTGAVQLMSSRGGAVLDHVKTVGVEHKLTMLPVLKKPFSGDAIVNIIRELKLGLPPPVDTRIELDEALSKCWIEFWYQPIVNLRKKTLVGVEAFARLKELPFAEIKIDRSFINNCNTGVNAPLCKTIIDLAHNFGSTAVAVGIERAADALALVSMGCEYGQDFLFGQPMPEERFISLLRQRGVKQSH
jgi:CheY-like chemotaxis protein